MKFIPRFDDVIPIFIVSVVPGVITASVGPPIAEFLDNLAYGRHVVYMTYLLLGISLPQVAIMLTIVTARILFKGD